MTKEVVPLNTRYVPFVQQPYCCGPACIQMVLYKNHLPLLSQEQIGAELGLIVPTELKNAFYNVDARDKPVVGSGFGTRIQDPDFSLAKLIEKQAWPFRFTTELASSFINEEVFIHRLKELVLDDSDALICFQNDQGTGHVCVLDTIDDQTVTLMDPSQNYPKWRAISYPELFKRVQAHGDDNFGGIWILERV